MLLSSLSIHCNTVSLSCISSLFIRQLYLNFHFRTFACRYKIGNIQNFYYSYLFGAYLCTFVKSEISKTRLRGIIKLCRLCTFVKSEISKTTALYRYYGACLCTFVKSEISKTSKDIFLHSFYSSYFLMISDTVTPCFKIYIFALTHKVATNLILFVIFITLYIKKFLY